MCGFYKHHTFYRPYNNPIQVINCHHLEYNHKTPKTKPQKKNTNADNLLILLLYVYTCAAQIKP